MRKEISVFLALFVAVTLCLSGSSVKAREGGSLESEFEAAAQEYGVPEPLLKAIGYTNTRWEMPPPQASDYEKGDPEARGAYGTMSLYQNPSKDTLGRASELTGLSRKQLKTDREANIEGAAAVLADIQGEKPGSINGWYETVGGYGDGTLYADQVYEVLKSGASAQISTGERVVLEAQPEAKTQEASARLAAAADYGRATWYGAHSNNYTNANRGDAAINKIIIHVTQGSWSGAINWFKNPSARVSAHYTVRSSDGFIGQSVREKDIAWHAGNWSYNQTSIGIEHEGYVSQPRWFTDRMYRSSARLSAYLAKKYNIPIDRQHIIGHNEVPGATHTDPGRYWNWNKYLGYVRQYAGTGSSGGGGGGSSYQQVVDNSSERFSASSNWNRSEYSSQRHGSNYHFTTPKDVDDGAKFRLNMPSAGTYAVYAWWPANSGYNGSARFWILTSGGWKREIRSQRTNGGRWVELGSYEMDAGDKVRVKISRRSATGGYIIADAVKIVKSQ